MCKLEIYRGSVEDVLPTLYSNSFDGVLCDCPYGVDIARWDSDVPASDIWAEIGRVLRPGAFLFSFGSATTGHRLASAIEEGGFQLREFLIWLHGHGMPKSTNTALQIDKAAGCPNRGHAFNVAGKHAKGGPSQSSPPAEAYEPRTPAAQPWKGYINSLKPVYEPIIRGQWPLDGTCAKNAIKWGCGSLNIDACRLDSGRFPTNVVLDEEAVAVLDSTNKHTVSTGSPIRKGVTISPNGLYRRRNPFVSRGYKDSGGPSRFFKFCPKVSDDERNEGLKGLGNKHPTLKPLALTEWLAKLMLPPQLGRPRRLLIPYCGVFSEVIGAVRAGWDEVVGIELDRQYIAIGKRRLRYHCP
jgi:site-specific DNA-methyltransferase (adenine-specific)